MDTERMCKELKIFSKVVQALERLAPQERERVLAWVLARFGLCTENPLSVQVVAQEGEG
jgi:hypothetical protein